MVEKRKSRRTWSYGSSALVSTIVFLAILVFVALIAEKNPWRVDLSESGEYSLSDQTRKILKSLEKPVVILAFFATASPEQAKAKDLLDTYTYFDKKISYELIDPERQPDLARKYDIRSYGTLVVEGFDRKETIQTADEESITNAIFKLSRNDEKKIYFLKGHGEHPLEGMDRDGYGTVRSELQKNNYVVEELNLLQQEQVPKDVDVLIVAGPQKNLMEQEVASLKTYLAGGGKLMVFLDPFKDGGLRDFIASNGIQIEDDIVIDKLSRVFGGSYLAPVVMQYSPHKITENFNVATFYSEARSVESAAEPPEGVDVEVLASTSAEAWAEKNLKLIEQGQAGFDENEDKAGPISLVALAEIPVKQDNKEASKGEAEKEQQNGSPTEKPQKAYLLVAGDSDFASNSHFNLSGNGDFFLNMVNFLAEEESLISITPREKPGRPVIMTQGQVQLLFWTVLVLVPLLVLMAGLGVWRVRRTQR